MKKASIENQDENLLAKVIRYHPESLWYFHLIQRNQTKAYLLLSQSPPSKKQTCGLSKFRLFCPEDYTLSGLHISVLWSSPKKKHH